MDNGDSKKKNVNVVYEPRQEVIYSEGHCPVELCDGSSSRSRKKYTATKEHLEVFRC